MTQLNTSADTDGGRPNQAKKPYTAPKLVRYGDAVDLTKSLTGSIADLALGHKHTGDLG